jgi:hypothetical protein
LRSFQFLHRRPCFLQIRIKIESPLIRDQRFRHASCRPLQFPQLKIEPRVRMRSSRARKRRDRFLQRRHLLFFIDAGKALQGILIAGINLETFVLIVARKIELAQRPVYSPEVD